MQTLTKYDKIFIKVLGVLLILITCYGIYSIKQSNAIALRTSQTFISNKEKHHKQYAKLVSAGYTKDQAIKIANASNSEQDIDNAIYNLHK